MAGRRKAKAPEVLHTCGECAHGVDITEHWDLDIHNKKPICVRCPHSPKRARIKSERACEFFRLKRF